MAKNDFNHFVPACILKHWNEPGTDAHGNSGEGVYYYDISTDRTCFALGRGKYRYRQAGQKRLHVVQVNGERNVGAEEWFAGLENDLADFVDGVAQRSEGLKLQDLSLAVMAMIGLAYRSRYQIEQIVSALAMNPGKFGVDESEESTDARRVALENIANRVMETFHGLCPTRIEIYRSNDANFVIGDRPFFHNGDAVEGVLTKSICARLIPTNGNSSLQHCIATRDGVANMNSRQVLNAREWLVGPEAELSGYRKVFRSSGYKAVVASDEIVGMKPRHIKKGLRLK